jgi:hypothetical protein
MSATDIADATAPAAFASILCGIDAGAGALDAAHQAARLASGGGKLELLAATRVPDAGASPLQRMSPELAHALGSVSERVAHRALCSVLVAREAR